MADQKITELTELTAPASGDLLAIVDDPGGTPATKKITLANIGLGVVPTVLLDTTLTGSSAAITLNPVGTYDRIEIWARLRTDRNAATDTVNILFNNDTTAGNYRYAYQYGGSSTGGTAGDDALVGYSTGSTAIANGFSSLHVSLIDPSESSHQKNCQWESGVYGTAGSTILAGQGLTEWENTAAITRIDLVSDNSANFVAGSHCMIVGYTLL